MGSSGWTAPGSLVSRLSDAARRPRCRCCAPVDRRWAAEDPTAANPTHCPTTGLPAGRAEDRRPPPRGRRPGRDGDLADRRPRAGRGADGGALAVQWGRARDRPDRRHARDRLGPGDAAARPHRGVGSVAAARPDHRDRGRQGSDAAGGHRVRAQAHDAPHLCCPAVALRGLRRPRSAPPRRHAAGRAARRGRSRGRHRARHAWAARPAQGRDDHPDRRDRRRVRRPRGGGLAESAASSARSGRPPTRRRRRDRR
jgi:hypothetical protein